MMRLACTHFRGPGATASRLVTATWAPPGPSVQARSSAMRRGSRGFDGGIGHVSVTVQRGEHFAEHLYGLHCDRVHHKLKVRGAGARHRVEVRPASILATCTTSTRPSNLGSAASRRGHQTRMPSVGSWTKTADGMTRRTRTTR